MQSLSGCRELACREPEGWAELPFELQERIFSHLENLGVVMLTCQSWCSTVRHSRPLQDIYILNCALYLGLANFTCYSDTISDRFNEIFSDTHTDGFRKSIERLERQIVVASKVLGLCNLARIYIAMGDHKKAHVLQEQAVGSVSETDLCNDPWNAIVKIDFLFLERGENLADNSIRRDQHILQGLEYSGQQVRHFQTLCIDCLARTALRLFSSKEIEKGKSCLLAAQKVRAAHTDESPRPLLDAAHTLLRLIEEPTINLQSLMKEKTATPSAGFIWSLLYLLVELERYEDALDCLIFLQENNIDFSECSEPVVWSVFNKERTKETLVDLLLRLAFMLCITEKTEEMSRCFEKILAYGKTGWFSDYSHSYMGNYRIYATSQLLPFVISWLSSDFQKLWRGYSAVSQFCIEIICENLNNPEINIAQLILLLNELPKALNSTIAKLLDVGRLKDVIKLEERILEIEMSESYSSDDNQVRYSRFIQIELARYLQSINDQERASAYLAQSKIGFDNLPPMQQMHLNILNAEYAFLSGDFETCKQKLNGLNANKLDPDMLLLVIKLHYHIKNKDKYKTFIDYFEKHVQFRISDLIKLRYELGDEKNGRCGYGGLSLAVLDCDMRQASLILEQHSCAQQNTRYRVDHRLFYIALCDLRERNQMFIRRGLSQAASSSSKLEASQ